MSWFLVLVTLQCSRPTLNISTDGRARRVARTLGAGGSTKVEEVAHFCYLCTVYQAFYGCARLFSDLVLSRAYYMA